MAGKDAPEIYRAGNAFSFQPLAFAGAVITHEV